MSVRDVTAWLIARGIARGYECRQIHFVRDHATARWQNHRGDRCGFRHWPGYRACLCR
ncbi:protein of unknown function [Candidatus Filomicrobium marinum]|uniref:Uncharacterized protein n=1 Tax=Candidatus Filomicrobium marinum TaxID=1608628 RepID=A0A0D6JIP7_9HYPH|nr:protein of unknown function [Candidatus Filomicrobium marinum]